MTKIGDDGTGLVSIGQLAKAAGVSSRTIRYYEQLGILPEPRRSPGGTRKYPQEYGGYIAAALALKDLGFRLEEVKPLARLAAGRSVSQGQRDAAARLVEDKIEALARQVTVLRRLHDSVQAPESGVPLSAVLGTAVLGSAAAGMLGSTAGGIPASGRADLASVPAIPDGGAA
jgi:DNA-binding transcriptional MerR regulator